MLQRDKEKLQMKADVFKAIRQPVRLGILELLRLGEMPVGLIASKLGTDVYAVSRHLSLLRKQGIVADRKEGLRIFYKITLPNSFDLFGCVDSVVRQRLADSADPEG
jgi:DNA-binding transcriptional ArsR family regulator